MNEAEKIDYSLTERKEIKKILRIAKIAGLHAAANWIEKNAKITDGPEPNYMQNKIAWIKWYRYMTGCDLKDAVEEGKRRFVK